MPSSSGSSSRRIDSSSTSSNHCRGCGDWLVVGRYWKNSPGSPATPVALSDSTSSVLPLRSTRPRIRPGSDSTSSTCPTPTANTWSSARHGGSPTRRRSRSCIPKSAVCQPDSDNIRGNVRMSARYSHPWWASPRSPLFCGYRPVNNEPRDGEHSGAVACARVNRMPWAASWSSRGLDTSACP